MRYVLLYFKGMLMGAADLVPGVSGGTIALISGIYKELLESINAVSWTSLKSFKSEGIKGVWKKINGAFLLALFGGILSSVLIFSRVLEWLLINEPIGLWSFFFGLLVASILFLIQTELPFNLSGLVFLVLGAVLSYLITQMTSVSNEVPLWYLFLAGFIGISAMILPGLSGAYILFVMGVYQTIVSNVRQAQDLLVNFSQEQFVQISSILGVFILGILVGIKVFAKFLSWLLNRYPERSLAVLIGLMLGALNKVWPWQNQLPKSSKETPEMTVAVFPQHFEGGSPEMGKALILMFFGFVLLFALERSKVLFKK
ncbi:MAG: DUF368 domain-containing protein [Flavobacteriaceae bacterium]|nr:DUF368 domain-containing protein [Flavobacteriaceae bacterium]